MYVQYLHMKTRVQETELFTGQSLKDGQIIDLKIRNRIEQYRHYCIYRLTFVKYKNEKFLSLSVNHGKFVKHCLLHLFLIFDVFHS